MQLRPPKATDPTIRMVRASVAKDLPPGRHSFRNSAGNVASDASSTPSARNPFQVNATDTQRFSRLTVSATALADGTSPGWHRATHGLERAAETKEIHIVRSARHAREQNVLDVVELGIRASNDLSRLIRLAGM